MRITGIDLARGFALLGVFVAHTAPIGGDSPLTVRWLNIADHATTPLFTLLLGVSAGLATRRTLDAGGVGKAASRRVLAIRGLLFVGLGLLAGLAGASVIPIVHYLGVVTLVIVPALFLRTRWLVLASGVVLLASSAAIGPATSLRHSLMRHAIIDDSLWLNAAQTLVGFFFTDYGYRVSSLAVWALAGLAVSRLALTGRRRLLALGATGVCLLGAAVVATRLGLGTLEPHSGSAPELLKGLGLAFVAIAVSSGLAATPAIRLLAPLTALGGMTLTFYLAHIAALGMWTRLTGMSDDKWSILFALSVGSLACAWLIRLRWRRGPVEWLTGRVSRFRFGRDSLPA